MTTCLVTGGAGFIGSHLVEALLHRGHEVRVLDNLSTGNSANLAGVCDQVDLIVGDVLDLETLEAAVRGVDVIYHQAALASVPRSIADPWSTHEACATGTLRVLQAARAARVRRVVYAASSSAYGNSERLPKTETDQTSPLSPYAAAKLAGEHYCAAFSNVYGLETVRLRYFNVFGPRQSPNSPYAAVIPLFVQAMVAGRRPMINGDGLQSRDFTYIADVVQANLRAAQAPGVSGRVYNVACNRRTTLLELIAEINRVLGTNVQPAHATPRAGDVRHSQADITRAQADLGYQPSTDVAHGVRSYVNWFLEQTQGNVPQAATLSACA